MKKALNVIVVIIISISVVLAFFVVHNDVENFSYLRWFTLLEVDNPIEPFDSFLESLDEFRSIWTTSTAGNGFFEALQDIGNTIIAFGNSVIQFFKAFGEMCYTAVKDVVTFFQWLTLANY